MATISTYFYKNIKNKGQGTKILKLIFSTLVLKTINGLTNFNTYCYIMCHNCHNRKIDCDTYCDTDRTRSYQCFIIVVTIVTIILSKNFYKKISAKTKMEFVDRYIKMLGEKIVTL